MRIDQPNPVLPNIPLIGIGLIIAVSIVGVAAKTWLVDTAEPYSAQASVGQVVKSRALRFVDAGHGEVIVSDWSSGKVIRTLPAGEDNFIRGVIRGLARERRQLGLGQETAFLIKQYDSGRLVLEDPATQRVLVLRAYGATNKQAFQQLLDIQAQAVASR